MGFGIGGRKLHGTLAGVDGLVVAALADKGLRFEIPGYAVAWIALNNGIGLADRLVISAGIEECGSVAEARLGVIIIDVDGAFKVRLRLFRIVERLTGAAQIEGRFAVFRIDLERLLEFDGGLLVVVGTATGVKLQSFVKWFFSCVVPLPGNYNADVDCRLLSRINGLIARAVRLISKMDALNGVRSWCNAGEALWLGLVDYAEALAIKPDLHAIHVRLKNQCAVAWCAGAVRSGAICRWTGIVGQDHVGVEAATI